MTERIDIVADLAYLAEFLIVIKLAVERLTGEALGARHIAVRLHPPAVDGHPSALFDELGYLGKKLGVDLLDPFIIGSGGAGENKAVVFIEPVDCAAEGLEHFAAALLPAPKPYRVKVSVADNMYAVIHIKSSNYSKKPKNLPIQ